MMKSKQELLDHLHSLGISEKTTTHVPLFTVEQAQKVCSDLPPGGHCKNLFLKDDKKQFWLVVTIDSRVVNLKLLSKKLAAPKLHFAQEDLLLKYLGVTKGAVTPFGLINDVDKQVRVVLDDSIFDHKVVHFHPLSNDATTTISVQDFKKFLSSCGNKVKVVDFETL